MNPVGAEHIVVGAPEARSVLSPHGASAGISNPALLRRKDAPHEPLFGSTQLQNRIDTLKAIYLLDGLKESTVNSKPVISYPGAHWMLWRRI
ncbi:hypothetical protein CBM2633_B80106 [Cupriavidus taiwanensis]|nr:hypothetical protein CBM2604_B60233 [Cupriavidus taiwanensis]SOZ33290.1 hypothetical protein CBM2609_B70234 [Cupriavidus taiwanensis]SOZ48605.1 hypothetical protein CBM2610_B50234 [Cupriavidus taiwanensis]SPA22689.1 hypothetical protein CBM2633_B80106 [Cupriavidus taiwanensis]